MRIPITCIPLFVLAACRLPAPAPIAFVPTDTGAFVIVLGNDTLSAESFTRSGNRVEGVIVRRVPRTAIVRYNMTLAANGLPSRLEYTTRLPDGTIPPNGARSVVSTFTADSVITEVVRDSIVTRRIAERNAYPEMDGAVSFYGLPIAALRSMGADSADFAAYPPGVLHGHPSPTANRGSNRYWVYSFGSPVEVVTDAAGRIQSVDGSRTTFRIQARRQPSIDVPALAARFLDRERASGPVRSLSPRDSLMATIAGARLSVHYGRPSARGRTIWGADGVLGDTLWRTGANNPTQLTTDRPITIGGRSLPAGTYTLTTLAVPGRYHLIFSGPDEKEVLRVPLRATPLDPRVERFTILIEPGGDRAGNLRLQWDALELSAPITVPAA